MRNLAPINCFNRSDIFSLYAQYWKMSGSDTGTQASLLSMKDELARIRTYLDSQQRASSPFNYRWRNIEKVLSYSSNLSTLAEGLRSLACQSSPQEVLEEFIKNFEGTPVGEINWPNEKVSNELKRSKMDPTVRAIYDAQAETNRSLTRLVTAVAGRKYGPKILCS